MSRSVQPTNYHRPPMHISEVLAETFRHTGRAEDLTAWVDAQPIVKYPYETIELDITEQPIPGQMELPFCQEINSEFTSNARPGADWGTWEVPC